MNELPRNFQPDAMAIDPARVDVLTAAEVARCRRWARAFAAERKDHRFYEIVEETMRQGFDYRYFALRDAAAKCGRWSCGGFRTLARRGRAISVPPRKAAGSVDEATVGFAQFSMHPTGITGILRLKRVELP